MPRYRRPRRQGVVYGPVIQHERGPEGGFLGRILGLLIVLGAVAVLGVGALNFLGDRGVTLVPAASPTPPTAGEASPTPTPDPTPGPTTPTPPPPTPPPSTPEPSPAGTPFDIEVREGPGFITFGLSRTANLGVSQVGTAFEVGDRPFYRAELSSTTPTDGLRIEISRYDPATDGEEAVTQLNLNAAIPRVHTVRQRMDTSQLSGPGIYVMRFVRNADVVAEGWFELTEP